MHAVTDAEAKLKQSESGAAGSPTAVTHVTPQDKESGECESTTPSHTTTAEDHAHMRKGQKENLPQHTEFEQSVKDSHPTSLEAAPKSNSKKTHPGHFSLLAWRHTLVWKRQRVAGGGGAHLKLR